MLFYSDKWVWDWDKCTRPWRCTLVNHPCKCNDFRGDTAPYKLSYYHYLLITALNGCESRVNAESCQWCGSFRVCVYRDNIAVRPSVVGLMWCIIVLSSLAAPHRPAASATARMESTRLLHVCVPSSVIAFRHDGIGPVQLSISDACPINSNVGLLICHYYSPKITASYPV